jgi:hypothetical protein
MRTEKVSILSKIKNLNNNECLEILTSCKNCCKIDRNCLLEAYSDNVTSSIELIRSCRELMFMKSNKEIDSYVLDKFREYIVERKRLADGTEQFITNWKAPNEAIICKHSWCILHGITMYKIKAASRRIKVYFDARDMRDPPYTDAHLHDINYNDSETLLEQNCFDSEGVADYGYYYYYYYYY